MLVADSFTIYLAFEPKLPWPLLSNHLSGHFRQIKGSFQETMCSFLPPQIPETTYTQHVRMIPTSPANTWENLMLYVLRRPVPETVVPDTWKNMLLRILGKPIAQVMIPENYTIMHETFLPCNSRLYEILNLGEFNAWTPYSYWKLAMDAYPYIPWENMKYMATWKSIFSWEQVQHFGTWRSVSSSMNIKSSLRASVLLFATLYYTYQYAKYFRRVSCSSILLSFRNTY